jgi:hypothetical protein
VLFSVPVVGGVTNARHPVCRPRPLRSRGRPSCPRKATLSIEAVW